MAVPAFGDCSPYFVDELPLDGGAVRVYRCDWGWCVKRGQAVARSRYLDDAFARVVGPHLDRDATRALVDTLARELTAEQERTGRTALRTLEAPTSAEPPIHVA
jgi:hypothetical protein